MGSHEALSVDPFKRLVKLAARAFYDDITTKGDKQPKTGRSDNRGIAVVVLDALTRRQWVREEDLAKDLKLHSKQLRRTLRFFEEEKLVTRDHRKETAKGAKIYSAAVAATGDGQPGGREGDEKLKLHTHSYCCLDYAQIYDVVRYRLHRMKKKLKDELESKNTVQEYICPNCSKRYTALDALRLISPHDEYFHCESCDGVLVAEADKLAAQELGDGDDNARRRCHEKLKDMLQNMEVCPCVVKYPQKYYSRLQVTFCIIYSKRLFFYSLIRLSLGGCMVEVAFSGIDGKGENIKLENGNAPVKDEYVKAYYAALLTRQREQQAHDDNQQQMSNAVTSNGVAIPTERQVGMKSKRGDEFEGDDVEWDEEPPAGNTAKNFKVNDLNVEAEASDGDEDEDDIDWEEG
ncbi:general transcription factor IIE subunit 1 [Olea europaea subsp. europaea]|uniref:General transcription factor IIE subunit 1 n=1 Tax=Olea europaea subsp. europaea TaxID=158383 RepID=A0A8S0VA09_OLEEU|nr:general transcription factor IIE subunit 1 [Olea europaea subsp. europaea]CAA3027079.1 general transcription factor IIE subunit 1 [Olea europaea subsp. europaea]